MTVYYCSGCETTFEWYELLTKDDEFVPICQDCDIVVMELNLPDNGAEGVISYE